MKISQCYLKFIDPNDNFIFVSVDSLLDSGVPIDVESGEELEVADGYIYSYSESNGT